MEKFIACVDQIGQASMKMRRQSSVFMKSTCTFITHMTKTGTWPKLVLDQNWSDPSIDKNEMFLYFLLLFLTHLSHRLIRWAYSIAMVRCPSVIVVHIF